MPGYAPPNGFYEDPYPDAVTLTLGANDTHFRDLVIGCYALPRCDQNASIRRNLDANLKQQKHDLELVLSEITNRHAMGKPAPLTVVTTYFDPFPDVYPKKACSDLSPVRGLVKIAPAELAFLKTQLLKLDDNIRAVVRKHSSNTRLVDIENFLTGQNKWCGSDPWIYGPSIETTSRGNPSPFHPTPYAQTIIANKVAAVIKAHFHL